MDNKVTRQVSDVRHYITRNVSMAASKGSLFVLNGGQSLTHGFNGLFHALNQAGTQAGLSGGAAAIGGLGGLVAVGAVGVISAALAQMDHRHEIAKIKELYRNEIAAKLGRPAKSITDDDLYLLAKGDPERGIEGNKIIAEEISKQRKERTLNVFLSAAATMTSFAVVHAVAESVLKVAADAIGVAIGLPPGAVSALAMVFDIAVGVGVYNMLKNPLHSLGHSLFGLDKKTTHDHIAEIQKDLSHGRGITQEQVLGVFVSANKQLAEFINNEYGKEFKDLSQHERQQVVGDINQLVPLSQMTDDINKGKYDVGELAFAVEGKSSGYLPHMQERPRSWLNDMSARLRGMFRYNKQAAQHEPQQEHKAADRQPQKPQQDAWHPAQDREAEGRQSFTERYTSKKREGLGHVERLDQGRGDPAMGSQLI